MSRIRLLCLRRSSAYFLLGGVFLGVLSTFFLFSLLVLFFARRPFYSFIYMLENSPSGCTRFSRRSLKKKSPRTAVPAPSNALAPPRLPPPALIRTTNIVIIIAIDIAIASATRIIRVARGKDRRRQRRMRKKMSSATKKRKLCLAAASPRPREFARPPTQKPRATMKEQRVVGKKRRRAYPVGAPPRLLPTLLTPRRHPLPRA